MLPFFIHKKYRILFILLSVMTVIGFCSCNRSDPGPPATPGGELQGKIRVSGAWALYPMMVKWAEEFQKIHPKVRIDLSAGGAGKGVADALSGLVDIGMVSREIKPEEIKQGVLYIPVVKDAVFPVINADNPMSSILLKKGIKKQTFIDLWINGKTLTWGGIAGTNSKHKVQVYTRSDSCGAAETWAQYLGGKKQEDLEGIGVYGDPGLAEAVRKDALGIGYNNLNYAFDAKSGLPVAGLQIIPIDVNENGKVDAEENLSQKSLAIKAVASGAYPSPPARDLYLVTKGEFKGIAGEFVKWILKDGQKYTHEVGYINLSKEQLDKILSRLKN
jgi:phosphate transport system substrate-binding protein